MTFLNTCLFIDSFSEINIVFIDLHLLFNLNKNELLKIFKTLSDENQTIRNSDLIKDKQIYTEL